jgi:hypothetical protein
MRRTCYRTCILILLALALGVALRLWFIWHFPQVNGDGLIYGDIAQNWLRHGIFGTTEYANGTTLVHPTLIRLPGYPLFLAVCFRIFGMEHYGAVLYLQVAIDLLSALLVSWTTRVLAGERAAMVALYLAALCPFTANYVAAPLGETLSIFCVVLACAGLVLLQLRPGWRPVLLLAFTWSYATLLRPDGALLAIACFLAIVSFARSSLRGATPLGRSRAWRIALTAGVLSILPFVPWTMRNLHTFHVFEPLAPRYANDPGEFTAPGFQRWVKTWMVEFASTSEIYWNLDSGPMDLTVLPARAFDSAAQREQTAQLFDKYNQHTTVDPSLDRQFAALAREREHAHPLRSYVVLPLLRVADMWLRPRTEMLDIELRWWHYDLHPGETVFAAGYAALNLLYLVMALAGAWRLRRGRALLLSAMLGYCLLRSLLLATIEAPEARYTVEAFPILCVLGAAWSGRDSTTAGP